MKLTENWSDGEKISPLPHILHDSLKVQLFLQLSLTFITILCLNIQYEGLELIDNGDKGVDGDFSFHLLSRILEDGSSIIWTYALSYSVVDCLLKVFSLETPNHMLVVLQQKQHLKVLLSENPSARRALWYIFF